MWFSKHSYNLYMQTRKEKKQLTNIIEYFLKFVMSSSWSSTERSLIAREFECSNLLNNGTYVYVIKWTCHLTT